MSDGKEEKQEPASFEKNSSQDENIAATPKQAASKGFIELGGARHLLTGQQPSWASDYVRGSWIQSDKNVWNYEVVNASRFGDNGIFLSGGLTRNFSDAWYGSLALGTSEGGFFWPRYRVDAFLHHKLLEKKNLVATVGLTILQAKDIHHDRILHLGADYYFENPWIVSGEFVVNNSSPGNVNANYAFLAATYGRDKNQYLTLRLGSGKEAYQLLGNSQVISGFYSRIATVTYRKWVGREWGFNVVGEEYTNPLYGRRGIQFGIFKDL
jgi:YaiO family outer membrane protein